ncbi:MAG TPA: hypothetical protein VMU83_13665 [Hanamia sp.]|nr:hypothetical protein [Hanamia sp.]
MPTILSLTNKQHPKSPAFCPIDDKTIFVSSFTRFREYSITDDFTGSKRDSPIAASIPPKTITSGLNRLQV